MDRIVEQDFLDFYRGYRAELNSRWAVLRNSIQNAEAADRKPMADEKNNIEVYLKLIAEYEKYSSNHGHHHYFKTCDESQLAFIKQMRVQFHEEWIIVREEIRQLTESEAKLGDCLSQRREHLREIACQLHFFVELEHLAYGLNNKKILGEAESLVRKLELSIKSKIIDNQYGIIPGDHIFVDRQGGLYQHHGIYIGNNQVVHYAGWANELKVGKVEIISLENFRLQETIKKFFYADKKVQYSRIDTVKRAKSRLNEDLYDLFSNNCKHFSHWCITGDSHSQQISQIYILPLKLPLVILNKAADRFLN
ncbi:lecithin retinol acyltransferase family protein [Acinetobacter sp. ANC 3813]|uniref:lecithin retinol acyltransferase family protein n=1 Tax=Acinetobacter sp. ANC 3813 TaxID=1977873 RepID=UPI000A337358|nr:lecithin retinol acyltransferase family protein [Acinetobacter sp. ANC 3813]OTG91061.1 hypothetical protein B9T34_06785 [Acinetobacter sp. ANC 3813]